MKKSNRVIRILTAFLSLLLLASAFVGCTMESIDSTDSSTGGNGSGSAQNETGEAVKTTTFAVVYSHTSTGSYSVISGELAEKLNAIPNVSASVFTDDQTVTEGAMEILVGSTNRKITKIYNSKRGFMLAMENGALAIIGFNAYDTICGVRYFEETYLESAEKAPVLDDDYFYQSDALDTVTAGEYISYVNVSDTLRYTKVASYKGDTAYTAVQGGCTDGTYFYLITNSGASTGAYSEVLQIDPSTYEIVNRSKTVMMEHANDMTYDSLNKRLLVSWCNTDPTQISVISPETMNKQRNNETVSGDDILGIFAIAYNEETNQYAVAKSKTYDIGILDSNFKLVRTITGKNEGYTKQGMHCDADYIYYLLNVPKTGGGFSSSVVYTYDWEGNLVRTFTLDLPKEAEHIYWYKGNFYIGANNGDIDIYRLDFSIQSVK